MSDTLAEMTARLEKLEQENKHLRALVETNGNPNYDAKWVEEQFKHTIALCAPEDQLSRALLIFGNRVLMQFGDYAGMHKAFSDAHARDNADPAPNGSGARFIPAVAVPTGWTLEVAQNDYETQLCIWSPTPEGKDAFLAVPVDSEYAQVLRDFAGALETLPVDAWQDIQTAPQDEMLLLAAEFDGPGDWRIKMGGYWEGSWHVQGASWKPTRWRYPPAPPFESVKAAQLPG